MTLCNCKFVSFCKNYQNTCVKMYQDCVILAHGSKNNLHHPGATPGLHRDIVSEDI